jgi:RES domain-containing protein
LSIEIYRLESEVAFQKKSTFSGIGGIHADGRWHEAPRRIIYCAESWALAILEVRVHLGSTAGSLIRYKIEVEIDEDMIYMPEALPKNWSCFPYLQGTKRLGNNWYDSRRSLILKAPSAVSPDSYNYLINAEHQDFSTLKPSEPEAIALDSRLV